MRLTWVPRPLEDTGADVVAVHGPVGVLREMFSLSGYLVQLGVIAQEELRFGGDAQMLLEPVLRLLLDGRRPARKVDRDLVRLSALEHRLDPFSRSHHLAPLALQRGSVDSRSWQLPVVPGQAGQPDKARATSRG